MSSQHFVASTSNVHVLNIRKKHVSNMPLHHLKVHQCYCF